MAKYKLDICCAVTNFYHETVEVEASNLDEAKNSVKNGEVFMPLLDPIDSELVFDLIEEIKP
jgi:hypothetical protein